MAFSTQARATASLSALIASHNEAYLLVDRVPELMSFCDEVIVIDIDSTDATSSVGNAAGARVVQREWVAIAEHVREEVSRMAQHELLVVSDPDEEIPAALARQLADLPSRLPSDVGIVIVPLIYEFAGKPLRGTVWGGVSKKQLVIRRDGVSFVSEPHHPYDLRPGFRREESEYDGGNAIRHHWVPGYRAFVSKHLRYARLEGVARARAGELMGFRGLARTPWSAFRVCYLTRKGYLDGSRGFVLSVLYSAYRTASDVQLLRSLRASGRYVPA